MSKHYAGVLAGAVVWVAVVAPAWAITYDIRQIGPSAAPEQYIQLTAINAAGQVLGYTEPAAGTSSTIWLYDPVAGTTAVQGLTDAEHTYAGGSQAAGWFLTDSGTVVGASSRYGPNGTGYGADIWTYDPATGATSLIGPTDAAHTNDGVRLAYPVAVSASGLVIGETVRADSVGSTPSYDAWIYSPASDTTRVIGLTDASHTPPGGVPDNQAIAVNASGVVIGTASRTEGQFHTDAWIYNPANGTYRTTGLLDAAHTGGYGSNHRPVAVNALGQVIGTSDQSAVSGTDAWFDANDGTPARLIGLTDAEHSWPSYTSSPARGVDNQPLMLDSAGRVVVGTAERVAVDGTFGGQDAWAYSPATGQMKVIGLDDADHTDFLGRRNDTPVLMNASGLTIGSAERYADAGQVSGGRDLWAYDPSTGATADVGRDLLGGTGIAMALGNDGLLVGKYSDGVDSRGNDLYGLFAWTAARGAEPIPLPAGYEVADGPTVVMNDADQIAVELTVPGVPDSTATFLLSPSAAPEPTTAASLGLAMAWLGMRRPSSIRRRHPH